MPPKKNSSKIGSEALSELKDDILGLSKLLSTKLSLLETSTKDVQHVQEDQTTVENEGLKSATDKLESETAELKARNETLTHMIEDISSEVRDLDQSRRLFNLEITGIPEQKDEDPRKIALMVAQLVDPTINGSDIDIAHRIGSRKDDRPRSIIVRFSNRRSRNAVYKGRCKLKNMSSNDIGINGQPRDIFINENLVPSTWALMGEVNEARREAGFRYLWTYNGQIHLRKDKTESPITIRNRADLAKIKGMGENQPPSSQMHNGRQRLRPFLISLIDSGNVKGLQWLDKEKTLFKIPWKHAGKQDYDPQEDSKIFMLWSRNTGKYKEGIHEPEPAVWKTRLRTALNKLPDIEEIHEKTQLDIPEPYRVYKLLPKKTGGSNVNNKSPHPGCHDYPPSSGRTQRSAGGNFRAHHSTGSYPTGIECPDMPHPSYPSHYPSIYDYPAYQNPMCEVGMGYGLSPTSGSLSGFGYYPHHQQSVMTTSSGNRHHPYHPSGHRAHHNSTGSSVGSVAELNEITEVINEDLSTGNMNDHQGHHYTNMDNMDVDIQAQMKMDSNTAMHQYVQNNNNDPSQTNYHDAISVTSSGITPFSNSARQVPHPQSYSVRSDYDHQQASPPTAINAITIASNVLSGEGEGLEACTAASVGMQGHTRRPIKDEDSHCLPSEHEMSIQMYYRSTNVGFHHVQAEGGCMIYFKEHYEAEVRRNMQLIKMPDIKSIPETEIKGKHREYIGKILDCCDRGLSLTCRDGCIYVKRHCRSVLFWSTSEDGTRCEKLERDVETKIFDLNHFRQSLRQYYEGSIPSPVVPEINFSIAQKLCDSYELKACFVTFVVRPLRAVEELRTLNVDARSLPHSSHSGLLKFSGPEMHNDVFTNTSVSPLLAAGLGPWGDMSPYAASCPMIPQPQIPH
ncbi:uncharacterized protein LOC121407014 isoform X2 [Lytechinus variegatus]|uniref:uncharacterized protein LOC121407014 isoform X2 n=1 Tax=Lytechinus variegatus TaxID=7654 RepID=UPI001BB262DA|nr:uncharacterized protein LOC121407014 isoform X2 [Lytechinus variegatus]